jgi:hypothetical protein
VFGTAMAYPGQSQRLRNKPYVTIPVAIVTTMKSRMGRSRSGPVTMANKSDSHHVASQAQIP